MLNLQILSIFLSFLEIYSSKVLLLSLDGFRWDYFYMHKEQLPNLHKIAQNGVFVHNGLMNNWVTNTFPSHRSLLTGLYEESHGIVGNTFFAPELNDTFYKWTTDEKFWNWSTPIWKVAEDQGVPSGCVSIAGCDVKEQQPSHFVEWSRDYTFRDLIDKSVDMFMKPKSSKGRRNVDSSKESKKPAEAVFFYYYKVDYAGHKYGPDGKEMKDVLKEVDNELEYLVDRLATLRNFYNIYIDLIITSDHGMLSINKTIVLDNDINKSVAKEVVNRGNIVHIWPYKDPSMEPKLMAAIDKIRKRYPKGFKVTRKEDLPDRLHFKKSIRCPPLMLIAEPHYEFIDQEDEDEGKQIRGNHGYYPERKDMHPIFIASGRSFKENYNHTSPQIQLVDVMPLVAHLLNITPNANNGSLRGVNKLLVPGVASNQTFWIDSATINSVNLLCLLLCCLKILF